MFKAGVCDDTINTGLYLYNWLYRSTMAQANDHIGVDLISTELKETLEVNEHSNQTNLEKTTMIENKKTLEQITHDIKPNERTLVDLPPELILLIFSHIEARFTLTVLCRVCKLINHLLSSEATWKTRFGKTWPKRDRKEDYDYIIRYGDLLIVEYWKLASRI